MNQSSLLSHTLSLSGEWEQQNFGDKAASQSDGRYSTFPPISANIFREGWGNGRSSLGGINLFVSDVQG